MAQYSGSKVFVYKTNVWKSGISSYSMGAQSVTFDLYSERGQVKLASFSRQKEDKLKLYMINAFTTTNLDFEEDGVDISSW